MDQDSAAWQRLPCESGACPEIRFRGDQVELRESSEPAKTITLSRDGFQALKTAVKAGLI